jgi:hypothetical protein
MGYRKKLIFLVLLIALVSLLQYMLPGNRAAMHLYSQYVFKPFQTFRNVLLGGLPVSIGDLLYTAGFIVLTVTLIRWGYFLVHIRTHRHYLIHSLMRSGITLGVLYVLFFIGWGGNYYRTSLSDHWRLGAHAVPPHDSMLFAYDRFLINKLNELAPHYRPLRFQEVDRRAQAYFKVYTDSRTRMHGLNAKASIFGYFMQYIGIQGYYNPFTGEAQVNRFQPSFMLPFVVCHELAHQSGIAAEGDANLLSYALCTSVPDTTFLYSGYLNSWLYTNARLYLLDSVRAKTYREELNPQTIAHIDTLFRIRRRYRSEVGVYSRYLYDGYLRLHNQKDGIRSYNRMAYTAWLLEQQRSAGRHRGLISIP